MTIRELFDYVLMVKPHVFSDEVQLLWLNELEGRLQLDVFLLATEEVKSYSLPEDENTQLLVDLPHTGIYRYWMEAMVDLENGEYSKYQNDMEVFNNAWNEYACWFAETQGTEGDGVKYGFYLSAYGIAVKHGYTGSEEEWLESLHGKQGDPFRYEDFTEEQLEKLRGPRGPAFTYEDFTEEQLKELTGPAGNGIESIVRTEGNGTPGTTDTYTITMTDGSTALLYVYNGKDGEGAGDMTAAVYDPHKKAQDIFAYADNAVKGKQDKITGTQGQVVGFDASGNPVAQEAPQSSSMGAASYALSSSAWAQDSDGLYAQTIAVSGVTTDPEQVIVVDVQQTGTDTAADTEALAAWAGEEGSGPASWYVAQGSGTLTFHAKEAPTVNIPLNIAVGVS